MNRSVTVLVPTWQRPASLARCLRALASQSRPADEVIVVTREGDAASADAARSVVLPTPQRCRVLVIPAGGVVAALRAGLEAASGEIIVLTDDDAEARPDWIARLVATLERDRFVGGVGGRDWQPHERGDATLVGRVQWFGRVVGRHHLGAGAARDVDMLKGVNCAYRAPLLRAVGFDARLRGSGAELHWELGLCLPLRRAGWRLVYDPAIAVDHHVEARSGSDELHRGRFGAAALVDAVHNESLAVGEHLSLPSRVVWSLWSGIAGTVAAPGLLNAIRLLAQGKRWALEAWRAARHGRALARATRREAPRVALTIPPPGSLE